MIIKDNKNQTKDLKNIRISNFVKTSITTILVLLVFFLIGSLIDQKFNIKPWGVVVMIIISYPITQLILIRRVKSK